MAYAKKSVKITKGIFDAAKLLIENGANNTEVARYLKVSSDVVAMFRKSETYEEYQTIMYEYSQNMRKRAAASKAKEKEQEKTAEPTKTEEPKSPTVIKVEANHYMMEEMKKTNELLKGISAKLAFIVEELTGVKS